MCESIVDRHCLCCGRDGSFWLYVASEAGFADIGFCTRDVNTSGAVWMAHQPGKAWVYRLTGLFADSWVLHGRGPSEQGRKYGAPYQAGDIVTAWQNHTHLEFKVNGVSQGVVVPAKPLPAGVVGCAGVCSGGALSTHGCANRSA